MYTSMRYQPLMATLQKYTDEELNAEKLGEILLVPKEKLGKLYARIRRNSEFTALEVKTLIEYCKGDSSLQCNVEPDAVEIKYFYDEKLKDLLKVKELTSLWLDRELIHMRWKKDEKDLRYLSMPGDSMYGGNVPLADGDILIIDTSLTDIRRSGMYAYTTHDDRFIGVNKIILKPNMDVKFDFWNENRKPVIYTEEEFKKLKFRCLGRAIRSLSIYKD